jgi:hypothetical protein
VVLSIKMVVVAVLQVLIGIPDVKDVIAKSSVLPQWLPSFSQMAMHVVLVQVLNTGVLLAVVVSIKSAAKAVQYGVAVVVSANPAKFGNQKNNAV